jgi:TRAP transporter TAXI family solute receptor
VTKRTEWLLSGAALLICLGLFAMPASCGAPSGTPRFLSIATGGVGGVYYPYGGAVARLVSAHVPGVQATAEVTGASVDNLRLLQQGRVDLAFTLADTLAEARAGTGPFADTGPVESARVLAVLYTNYTHIVVGEGSGIASVADLRGRVVSVGSPGSGTELIADRVLRAAGLDPRRDITRHALGVAESAGALKDGKLDAFIWSGGVPTPSVQDVAATPGARVALVPQTDVLAALQREYPPGLYFPATIPAGVYRGVDRDTPVVGVTNLLVAAATLDEDLTRDIVRVLFEHKAELEAAHPEGRHLERPTSLDGTPAPFHSGAVAFYRGSS